MRSFFLLLVMALLCGCGFRGRSHRGGESSTVLGGLSSSAIKAVAPESPQTPSTTTLRKEVVEEFAPGVSRSSEVGCSHGPGEAAPGGVASPVLPPPVRRVIREEAVSTTGAAQKDTSQDLSARLSNMRSVQWVGVLLLVAGPVVGWKLGWLTNGLVAGLAGLALIILAQVLPGNEAWLGLGVLTIIPLVAFVYYKSHHDAKGGDAS